MNTDKTLHELFEELNKLENAKDILDFVKSEVGTVSSPYSGPTYILPDGSMLNMRHFKHHAEIEKLLIDNGYSHDKYIPTGGSPTMRSLGALRCDTVKYYIDLPDTQLTREQYNTLLVWLDYLSKECRLVTVCADSGRINTTYKFNETISDDIVSRIRRYYISGRLYETMEIKDTRQYNAKFSRKPFGEELIDFDDTSILAEEVENSKKRYLE